MGDNSNFCCLSSENGWTLKGLKGINFSFIREGVYSKRQECASLSEYLFVCVEVLWPSQPNGVMLSVVSLPYHTFTGQA